MSKSKLNYNERAWAIDVISHINIYCSKHNLFIKRAGGENTLRGEKNLFPDVLLYGNERSGSVIQGWELKMPDTPITDVSLIENAKLKANRLGLTSFLLWNAREAVLYLKEKDDFVIKKNWIEIDIIDRKDVEIYSEKWKFILEEIISYLSNNLSNVNFKSVGLLEISSNLYIDSLKEFKNIVSNGFKCSSVKNFDFEIEITEWVCDNFSKKDLNTIDKYDVLAEFSILSWLNKFLFSHYLKTFNKNADRINELCLNSSRENVISVFHSITEKCDFMNVFISNVGDEYVSNEFMSYLLQVNELLKEIKFNKIESSYLHQVIDSVLLHSRKKVVGQFSTPVNLAYYLSSITMKDRTANIIDTCCGSGTIPKTIYQIKRESGISPEDALNGVWASDKFSYPLQLCSIALSDPQALGSLVQVFKKDVFELIPKLELSFIDPFLGCAVTRTLPVMHAVVSNLPFVRFEDADLLQTTQLKELGLSGKSDLYAYIIFHLANLIEESGRIGVVISNSWLTTDWGNKFKELLMGKFKILKVICSSKGKWFNNADVVATLLILEKNTKITEYNIEFVTTNSLIEHWNKEILNEMITATLSQKFTSPYIDKEQHSISEIKALQEQGISWNALFTNLDWVNQVSSKLIKASELIDFARGERRGWDKMFYPDKSHNIEPEYIKPVLISSRDLPNSLVGEANQEAFCCSESLSRLQEKGHIGVLQWISKFENARNGIGVLLPDALKKKNHFWYEMKPDSLADMVISMNPDKKICVYRLKERSFVNQRLIRLSVKNDEQIDILHALLNSVVTLFYIETIGFGRGLGVLDLSSTTISRNLRILNPNLLSKESAEKIINKFKKILHREQLELTNELSSQDRIDFDKEVLKAFDIHLDQSVIYQSLLRIYQIRKSVEVV